MEASSLFSGVRNDSGTLNFAVGAIGKSPESESLGTSFLPPGGKTKSCGFKLWTSLSSTAWRASWMFANHGESPMKVVVGVGTSATSVAPLAPWSTK